MLDVSTVSPAQAAKILAASRRFGLTNVRVFGSRARGSFRSDSDLDLLVTVPAEATLLTLIGFRQALQDALGIAVDVVDDRAVSPYLRERVFAEATAIQ